ncbi:ferredoxin--NADP reductase [Pseudoalteromonas sp. T1lg75]|uniref:ferredoxin--NADP reductase n=1 Tax=Pseudoalteromonas sp. T1lg75 TaxID=2077102 RepID=UPI000CF6BF54|nr:ferredoxin--NADP reductase [Pseudoalteromonas sp. T1lg75]
MANWLEAKVKRLVWWNEKLFSLIVTADIDPFTAGQYTKLALQIGDERVARAYSFVNPPSSKNLEFYLIKVDDGALSAALARLQPGDSVQIAAQSNGFFTLDEVPSAEQLWMLSTGTAIGPFLSMLQEQQVWQQFQHIVLVHCVRHSKDLSYKEMIQELQEQHPQLQYVPVVTREDEATPLKKRIPALIKSGELFAHVQLEATPDVAQFMICGNPDMVKETTQCLSDLGYNRNRRRTPGHITVEQYW